VYRALCGSALLFTLLSERIALRVIETRFFVSVD
jgi:hypothetical protein